MTQLQAILMIQKRVKAVKLVAINYEECGQDMRIIE